MSLFISVLFTYGIIETIFKYGFVYLLAYLPIVYFWGFFWGIAPLIGMLKVYDTYKKGEFAITLIFQVLWIWLLFYLINLLGIGRLLPIIIAVSCLTGVMMPTASLRAEREEQKVRENQETR